MDIRTKYFRITYGSSTTGGGVFIKSNHMNIRYDNYNDAVYSYEKTNKYNNDSYSRIQTKNGYSLGTRIYLNDELYLGNGMYIHQDCMFKTKTCTNFIAIYFTNNYELALHFDSQKNSFDLMLCNKGASSDWDTVKSISYSINLNTWYSVDLIFYDKNTCLYVNNELLFDYSGIWEQMYTSPIYFYEPFPGVYYRSGLFYGNTMDDNNLVLFNTGDRKNTYECNDSLYYLYRELTPYESFIDKDNNAYGR